MADFPFPEAYASTLFVTVTLSSLNRMTVRVLRGWPALVEHVAHLRHSAANADLPWAREDTDTFLRAAPWEGGDQPLFLDTGTGKGSITVTVLRTQDIATLAGGWFWEKGEPETTSYKIDEVITDLAPGEIMEIAAAIPTATAFVVKLPDEPTRGATYRMFAQEADAEAHAATITQVPA